MEHILAKETPKLGFGLMRLPKKDGQFDLALIADMIDTYMKNGFTYFDTAYVYAEGQSENIAGELLVKRYPRNSFQLATKMPLWLVNETADLERIFSEQLIRTGTSYFDFYLLHGVNGRTSDRFPGSGTDRIEKFDAWNFLRQKKAEGKIKHIGFSFHGTAEVLEVLLKKQPDTEFVQLQINYADWEDDVIQSRQCYEIARHHNLPVIVMEPIKGGTLVKLRPDVEKLFRRANPGASLASWAIRYAASVDGILTVLSGMSDMEQMQDNISYMKDFKPINNSEQKVIETVRQRLGDIDSIGCTACRYCTDDCPMEIDIPHFFEIANDYKMYEDMGYSKNRYDNFTKNKTMASGCIACGSCESHCPQSLPIIKLLKQTAELFE